MQSARMWTGPEAISIWDEIVQARKQELQSSDVSETFSYATALAGHVALTRDQLAEWDNSARAWLRHADRTRSKQQTQVMLILSNLDGVAVNSMPSTYRSVIDAWVAALQGMENLIKGTSQGVSNGGLLLALASWHLYPDMIVSMQSLDPVLVISFRLVPLIPSCYRSLVIRLWCRMTHSSPVAPL